MLKWTRHRELDAQASGHRNYRQLTIARGGEVVVTMISR